MGGILSRLGVGRWRPNYPIIDSEGRVIAEIDFALRDGSIAIEVDGRAFHSDDLAFERDRIRQNVLTMRGWTVLRFTWRQIVHEPDEVARIVRLAVAQARVGEPTMYSG